MFEQIFNALMAWNQVGLILGGMVMLALGLVITGYPLYWMVRGTRLRGRIVGVRATGVRVPGTIAAEDEDEETTPITALRDEAGKKAGPLRAVLGGLLIFGVPLLFIIAGLYMGADYLLLRQNGIIVTGQVVDYDESYDSESGTSYYPIVSFTDRTGRAWRVADNLGGGGRPFTVGDDIAVQYDPANPEKFAIGSFWHNMLLPVAFTLMGALVLFAFMGGFMWMRPCGGRAVNRTRPRLRDYTGEMYYPIYEGRGPDGHVYKGEGDTGVNWLYAVLPGRTARLTLRNPEAARAGADAEFVTASAVLAFIGLVFVGGGIVLFAVAWNMGAMTLYVPLFALGLLVGLAWKRRKIIKPRAEWDTRDSFRARMQQKRREKKAQGRVLSDLDIRERCAAMAGYARFWVLVTFVLALGLAGGGAWWHMELQGLLATGQETTGTVIGFETTTSDGSTMYHAEIAYRDAAGTIHEHRDRAGSSHPTLQTGDSVTIVYDPNRPARAVIDRGWQNHAGPWGCLLGALFMLWVTAQGIGGLRRAQHF